MGMIGVGLRPGVHLRSVRRRRARRASASSAAPARCRRFVAAGLSAVNLVLALSTLPESLPPERRGKPRAALSPLDLGALRARRGAARRGPRLAINFLMIFWFAGMEQTFRLFTEDAFGMTDWETGASSGWSASVTATVQGGLIAPAHPALRRGPPGAQRDALPGAGVRAAGVVPAPRRLRAAGAVRVGGAHRVRQRLCTPTLPAYVSRRAGADAQGVTLGSLQSASALARRARPRAASSIRRSTPARPITSAPWGWSWRRCWRRASTALRRRRELVVGAHADPVAPAALGFVHRLVRAGQKRRVIAIRATEPVGSATGVWPGRGWAIAAPFFGMVRGPAPRDEDACVSGGTRLALS